MVISEFQKFLEKYKAFRELSEQYKSTKFCKLYYKMYEYMLSIPKEKIVISHITRSFKNSEYVSYLFYYIKCFLAAKDFYNWKYRIYSLLTENTPSKSYKRYNLLYNSKINEFLEKTQEKTQNTTFEKYKVKSTNQLESVKKKKKETCVKNYGVDHPLQSKEIHERMIKKKLKLYGNIYGPNQPADHSKSGDEICIAIDNMLGNPEDSKYAIKNREFFLNIDSKHIRKYDYCVPSLGIIVEVDDPYWHALNKNPDDILVFHHKKILAKEIWQRDKEKEELAIQNGYKVFHIRDTEYFDNKSKCLENLLKEIKNYVHSKENII